MSLEATVKEKLASKYDTTLEKKMRTWISQQLPSISSQALSADLSLLDFLKDGVVLCDLISKISGQNLKPSKTKLPFKQMENIKLYLDQCTKVGLKQTELFETLDLFEARDLSLVLANLHALYFIHEKYGDSLIKQSEPAKIESRKSIPNLLFRKDEVKKPEPIKTPTPTNSPMQPDTSHASNSPGGRKKEATPSVTSLTDDIATKEEFKYDYQLELVVKEWIEQVLGVKCEGGFTSWIKTGVVLCRLVNKIKPNTVASIYEGPIAYKQMQNIEKYLTACSDLGLPGSKFETNDLYNEKNLSLVITNIQALAHTVEKMASYKGPKIGDTTQSKSLFSATLVDNMTIDDAPASSDMKLTADQQDLLNWANARLLKGGSASYAFNNLGSDLKKGVKLIKLLEVVTKQPVGAYNVDPEQMWHAMQNSTTILRFIAAQTFERVEGCRAADIVMGRTDAISRMLAYLRDKFDLEYLYQKLIGDIGLPETDQTDDDEVEIEFEEGEEVPDQLRQFISETDLKAIDEAKQRKDREKTNSASPNKPEDSQAQKEPTSPSKPEMKLEIPEHKLSPTKTSPTSVATPLETPVTPVTKVSPRDTALKISPRDKSPGRPQDVSRDRSPSRPVETPTTPATPVPPKDKSPVKPVETPTTPATPVAQTPTKVVETPEKPHKTSDEHPSTPTTTKTPPSSAPTSDKEKLKNKDKTKRFSRDKKPSEESPSRKDKRDKKSSSKADLIEKSSASPSRKKKSSDEKLTQHSSPALPTTSSPTQQRRSKKTEAITETSGASSPRLESPRSPRIQEPVPSTPAKSETSFINNPTPSSTTPSEVRKIRVKAHVRLQSSIPGKDHLLKNSTGSASASLKNSTGSNDGKASLNSSSDSNKAKLTPEQEEKVAQAQATVRKHVANELLQTEKSYVKSLQTLKDGLITPLRAAKLISDEELYSAFANIEELLQLHIKFESLLSARIGAWSSSSILSDIFVSQVDFFARYEPFISNYNASILAWHYLRNKYPQLVQMIKAFEDELMTTTMYNTESFLIMPVQRIPRYILLLRDLKKYTSPQSKEFEGLAKALEKIDMSLQELNANIDRDAGEHIKKVLLIAQSITGESGLMAGSNRMKRQYHSEGEITLRRVQPFAKVATDSKRAQQLKKKGRWFLFNDLFVFCEPLKTATQDDIQQYAYLATGAWNDVNAIQLDDARREVTKENPPAAALTTHIRWKGDKKTRECQFALLFESEAWVLQANSTQEREKLLLGIKDLTAKANQSK